MASVIAVSEATTGSMLKPVMNLMSSMANTLVGSTMARVSEEPTRLKGRTWYLIAVSIGISLMTLGSTSKYERLIEGTPYWRRRHAGAASLPRDPRLTSVVPRPAPFDFLLFGAGLSCFREV